MAAMSSAQIISASAFHSKMALARGPGHPAVSGFWQGALSGQAGTSHDVKPFSQQTYTAQPALPLPGFESPAGPTPLPSAPPAPPWQGCSVASSKLWMLEFSAFLEQQQDPDTYNKHLFVHIGQSSPSYSDPYLEAVDIRQIYDKFPEKKGGLKELFERGPSNAFFLVKFWVSLFINAPFLPSAHPQQRGEQGTAGLRRPCHREARGGQHLSRGGEWAREAGERLGAALGGPSSGASPPSPPPRRRFSLRAPPPLETLPHRRLEAAANEAGAADTRANGRRRQCGVRLPGAGSGRRPDLPP
ncbi:transcriptional enhancer factor TEF-3-like [Cynocephalus volans]|uniref:transcriptional enhancer factor TEF-3-like n=1 Tax=Cynocephalus volans TaxID=110931 RepID=UPI002FCC601E